jgi:hypothetical protein
MYCTMIHCAAYMEDSFVANYWATKLSILLIMFYAKEMFYRCFMMIELWNGIWLWYVDLMIWIWNAALRYDDEMMIEMWKWNEMSWICDMMRMNMERECKM